jgi:epoxyqueuosine reductase
MPQDFNKCNLKSLAQQIKIWGRELGFAAVGISDSILNNVESSHYYAWLNLGYHGTMHYLERNASLRFAAENLLPKTVRIISCRLNYSNNEPILRNDINYGFIARYARGRDYHKLVRKLLLKLAKKIEQEVGKTNYRVFCDSAPVLEKALAAKAGLGWVGKNGLLLDAKAGSYFFLGEIYTDIPLPVDEAVVARCGQCQRCLNACPTGALIAPYTLDARRCLAYLTIEYHGSIPEAMRPLMGNKIFGCDLCQEVCPWNRFAKVGAKVLEMAQKDFLSLPLAVLFLWDEKTFLEKTAGTVLRRIGYECWLRNLAVALGNAEATKENIAALQAREHDPSALVREHVEWALK